MTSPTTIWTRRGLFGAAAGVVGASGFAASRRPVTGSTGAVLTSAARLPQPYTCPLPVPEVARPAAGAAFELVAREADLEILPGRRTRALTYGGTFPGPTIVATTGQETRVRLHNTLSTPTVLHLHGGVTAPEHDGYPTDVVHPGSTREYVYPLRQRAAPLWYHDHTIDVTGPNVYAGLAGAFVVHDPTEDDLGLPRDGRDIPLVVTDRAFDADAQFAYPAIDPTRRRGGVHARYHGGVLGDCVLVNGAPWPVLEVDAVRYRFRILNASNARRYELRLDSGLRLTQVGTDLGLLEQPVSRPSVTVAPAERADVVVDFSAVAPGTTVTMTNALGEGGAAQVLRFVVARRATDDTRVPDRLCTVEPVDPARVLVTRDLHFTLGTAARPGGSHDSHLGTDARELRGRAMWTVNGIDWAEGRDVMQPRLGTVERWRLSSDVHHPVHVHLLPMQTRDRQGRIAWKDTVDLLPGTGVEVLVPIEGFRGRYVLHCHNLEHEDMMMMAPFSVR